MFGTVRKLYQKVIDPGMMYGVEFWGREVLRREVLRNKWRAVQRKVLIKMVGAYRTVSADAVCVVAGVEPVDLRIEMLVRVAVDVVGGMDKVESVERRREKMMAKWQSRWEESEKGRVTYEYMREVEYEGREEWGINHCDAGFDRSRKF